MPKSRSNNKKCKRGGQAVADTVATPGLYDNGD